MSFINPSMGDSKPRPLSPKAFDLLQEIQSKFQQNQKQSSPTNLPSSSGIGREKGDGTEQILDNIPTLVKMVDLKDRVKAKEKKEVIKEIPNFDKNDYFSDTRSNKIVTLIGSTFILFLLTIGGYSLVINFLVPSFFELKALAIKSNAAASDASRVSNQIKGLKYQLSTEKDQLSNLIEQFPSLNETYTIYSAFLSALETSHVILVNQQATVTQTPNHPFINTSVTDEKNSFKPLDVAKRNGLNSGLTANGSSGSGPQGSASQLNQANNKSSASPSKSGAQTQQLSQTPAVSAVTNNASKSSSGQSVTSNATSNNPKGSGKDLVLTGEVKQGLNYYHLEMILKGSYVNYLFARQSLINAIPNSIVHRELIRSGSNSADPLEIKLYLSIPFLSDKGEPT